MEQRATARQRPLPAVILPLSLALLTLAVAVGGAMLTGPEINWLTGRVEALSAWSGNSLSGIGTIIPLGFAFGAGMVSAVNPCGFAMLPAYLGLYLGSHEQFQDEQPLAGGIGRGLAIGSAVTLGFVVLFGVVGLAITAGAQPLVRFFPWIGLGVGVFLIGVGAWLVSGRTLYTSLAERAAARVGDPRRLGPRGYVTFGLTYGIASLSCTLPIFLSVVGSGLTFTTVPQATLQFVLYGLGMGSVILILTLSMAVFRGSLIGKVRSILPYIQPTTAVLLLIAGAYIVYYWLTLGGLLSL